VEWAAWVVWAEWECNQSRPLKVFKNAREIKLSGVFFYFDKQLNLNEVIF
jgi:hypothetical protein